MAMLAAIQFDVQPGFHALEVQHVRSVRMLTTEFVGAEAPILQPAPQQAFGPRAVGAELAGEGGLFGASLERGCALCGIKRSPSP
jgi:hypothetical protein